MGGLLGGLLVGLLVGGLLVVGLFKCVREHGRKAETCVCVSD